MMWAAHGLHNGIIHLQALDRQVALRSQHGRQETCSQIWSGAGLPCQCAMQMSYGLGSGRLP